VNPEGYALGTLCVIDHVPKKLSERQITALKKLGYQLVQVMELRKKVIQLDESRKDLARSNAELERFARVVAHDLKTPLSSIVTVTELFKLDYADKLGKPANDYLTLLGDSAVNLTNLVNGILAYSKVDAATHQESEKVNLSHLFTQVRQMVEVPPSFQIVYSDTLPEICVHKVALQQILLNLVSNAIKYNHGERGRVEITFSEAPHFYRFAVKDNGMGIPKDQQEKVFELFATLEGADRFHKKGTGIGLSTVKKLVERLGGEITVQSEVGVGSQFTFTCRKQ
jgi:signal transduction histidine kinase